MFRYSDEDIGCHSGVTVEHILSEKCSIANSTSHLVGHSSTNCTKGDVHYHSGGCYEPATVPRT
jgi:hypothetical protein